MLEERIAENLSTIVYTTTFFDQVINSGFEIDTLIVHKFYNVKISLSQKINYDKYQRLNILN